jgi:hypothetical protein
MASIIQLRRGTALEWATANPVLAEGELCVELDTSKCKVGNGVQHWNDLSYSIGANGANGQNGQNGAAGRDGVDGVDGMPGPMGPMGGTVSASSRLNIIGSIKPLVSTSRWYPMKTVSIIGLSANVGKPSTTKIELVVRRNGALLQTMVILPNQYKSQNYSNLTYALGINDYLTLDIVSADGVASNLNLVIEYFPHDNITLTASRLNFIGPITPIIGSSRWYPSRVITLRQVHLTVGSKSISSIFVDILLNGVVILSLNIDDNQYRSITLTDLNTVINESDYITANITAAVDGRNLSVVLEYT